MGRTTRRWRILLVVLALGALTVAACRPIQTPGGGNPFPAPDAPGPYAVGRTTFTLVDHARADRTLTVDAWYPVDKRDAVGYPPSRYDLLVTSITSPTALDSPPVSHRGPFPLVVFSHGSNGVRFQSWFLTEHLASQGFVVVAPDHAGNTAYDLLGGTSQPFDVMARARPLDVSFVITSMLQRSADPTDAFAHRIDDNRIGVVGHSFGGFTALAAAAGYQDVPPDPRVDAIVPISPASTPFTDAELRSIRTPALLLGGTADVTTPIATQTVRAWDLISSRPAWRVDVHDAGHASFTNICDLRDALLGSGLPPDLLQFLVDQAKEGCAPELIPIAEAHRLTNLYTTAFLRLTLDHDIRQAVYLTRAWAHLQHLPVDLFRR